jgi:23S rRNA pseudouridine1911/1915/1917 synthase
MTVAEQQHIVTPAQAGQRFDRVLAGLPGIVSRQAAHRLIASGAARLSTAGAAHSSTAAPDRRVRVGDVIAYHVPPPATATAAPEADGPPLDILYEDEWLVVLNKPAGLSMHPGPGHPGGTLVNRLLAHCRDWSGIGGSLRPGIVHRLDKDTTGVLVVAKHDAAHAALARQFKAHSIHRVYLALVVGRPPAERGTIDLPLARHPTQRVKRAVVRPAESQPGARGKRAVTHWQVAQRLGPLTLLRVTLETGRTHQIRVHLAHAGWPVLGDPLYGSPQRVKALRLPEAVKARLLAFPRQALHAAELGFVHPGTGKGMRWRAELAKEIEEIVSLLNL